MSRAIGLHQITRVVSDGTGRPPDEVVLLTAVAAGVVVSVAAARAFFWALDLAMDLELWPPSPSR